MSFKAEMEKWFHPHIVAQFEAEFARLEERIRLLESKVGIQIPAQGPAADSTGTTPPSA